jgi:predicted  nucleic acid-binding Zn-ribbon protein
MAGIPDILREIHRLRRHVRDLQAEIDRGPYQLKARRAVAAKAEEAFHAAQDQLKKLKIATHDKEVTLKTTHQQIAKYEHQLDEAADKKQYDALQHEIATARQKASALEDEILGGMAEAEERTAQLPEQERAAKKAREEQAAFEGDHAARLARLAEQQKAALVELKAVEETVPEQYQPQYQRMVNAYGADALASVQNQACANCHMQITVQQMHDLETGEFVCCRSCGRGLYLPR